jgi:hypothetical protein
VEKQVNNKCTLHCESYITNNKMFLGVHIPKRLDDDMLQCDLLSNDPMCEFS